MKKLILFFTLLFVITATAQDLTQDYRKIILNSPNNVSLFQSNSTNGIWAAGMIASDRWGIFEDATSSKERFSILPGGSIGINTTTPITGTKLTVVGHVNIGGIGNYHLRTRHIDGKHYETSEIDDLYLNYATGKDVLVGFGSTNPASDLKVSGRLGIGNANPTHHIDVMNTYEATESFLRFRVQDAPTDYFTISNGTSQEGKFIPYIKGRHDSDNRTALGLLGETSVANDIGTSALVHFDARRPGESVQIRPLFAWTSYTTKMMTMLANGNLGIGTTNPGSYKLAVNGNIRAKEIKVETGWSDFVFEDNYTLPTLEEVEQHIQENGHLKDIPSAEEVEENGIYLGEMDSKLLQKIEELTLYAIEQDKRIKNLEENNQKLIELVEKVVSEKQ